MGTSCSSTTLAAGNGRFASMRTCAMCGACAAECAGGEGGGILERTRVQEAWLGEDRRGERGGAVPRAVCRELRDLRAERLLLVAGGDRRHDRKHVRVRAREALRVRATAYSRCVRAVRARVCCGCVCARVRACVC